MIDVESENNTTTVQNKENNDYKTNSDWKLKKTLTYNEIVCTAILFLSAGYETTSTTLCFIAYNLAMNPVCQEKLIEEIDTILEKHVNFL